MYTHLQGDRTELCFFTLRLRKKKTLFTLRLSKYYIKIFQWKIKKKKVQLLLFIPLSNICTSTFLSLYGVAVNVGLNVRTYCRCT